MHEPELQKVRAESVRSSFLADLTGNTDRAYRF